MDVDHLTILSTAESVRLTVESVVENAYKKSCQGDWNALEDLHRLEENGYLGFWLYQCCLETILHNLKDSTYKNEGDVYRWFRDNYKNVLGNDYEIVTHKNVCEHIPDFWVMHKGEYIPVECKLNAFDLKALSQLQRYMFFYGAKSGIAVASECKVLLPDNIIFVKHDVTSGGRL